MNWKSRNVLITGAGGFIGSHLTERLVALGARTRAMVHYNALGSWGWLEELSARGEMDVVLGDIRDRDSVRNAMKGADVVFHLAALIGIPYSYEAPESYIQTNTLGTMNVLQAARELGVERIVHTSTSEVYGSAAYVPIDEKHPLCGQSPYSASKIGADKMAEAFHLSFGVPVVTVRPFNTFGPRQSARAVVPTIIAQCMAGRQIRLGNMHTSRDLNYVSDTVDGFVRAAESKKAVGMTINIGSGREITIRELVDVIARIAGGTAAAVADRKRVRPKNSEVNRLLADNTLARRALGWKPAVSLETGLTRTVEWMRSHMERYRPDAYTV